MSDRSRSRSPSPGKNDDRVEHKRDASRSRSPDQRDDKASDNEGKNVYVANLSYKTRIEDLEDVFKKFGAIAKCNLIEDPVTRESRGFGFINFEDARDAEDAIKELNGTELDGRTIRVEIAKRTRGHAKTPGQYLGPRAASRRGDGYGDRRGGYDRRGGSDRGYDRRDDRGGDRRDDRGSSRRDDRGGYDDRRYNDRY